MKAWQFYSIEDYRLEEVPDPRAGEGEVVIKVKVVQASVTEVIRSKLGPTTGSDRVAAVLRERPPVRLFGHEYSGEVVEVGRGVTRFKPGDRVAAVTARIPCGTCALCRMGEPDLCHRGPSVGLEMPGCFAEYNAVPAKVLVHLPDNVSFNGGACVQPLHTCMASVITGGIQVGNTIAILGQGVIGLGILQMARASGAGTIITTEIKPRNIELSKQFGADVVINARETDPVAAIIEATHGLGADIVYDAAGGSPEQGLAGHETLKQAVQVVKDEGKVIQPAIVMGPLGEEISFLRRKSLKLMWPQGISSREEEHIVHLLSLGKVQLEPTITHTFQGLEEMPRAFEVTGNKLRYGAINPGQVVVS